MAYLRADSQFVVLVLSAVRLGGTVVDITVDFGPREQEDLVGRGRGGARGVASGAAALVIGHLRDGLRLRLELGGQERPEVTDVETATEL